MEIARRVGYPGQKAYSWRATWSRWDLNWIYRVSRNLMESVERMHSRVGVWDSFNKSIEKRAYVAQIARTYLRLLKHETWGASGQREGGLEDMDNVEGFSVWLFIS